MHPWCKYFIFSLLFILAGCVVPDQYVSYVFIGKDIVKFYFKGNFVDTGIVSAYKAKTLSDDDGKAKTAAIMDDLKTSYAKIGVAVENTYLQPGEFNTKFGYGVPLKPDKKFEVLNMIWFTRDGTDVMDMHTVDVRRDDLARGVMEAGFSSKGKIVLRIAEGGNVLQQNAQEVLHDKGITEYVWNYDWKDAPVKFVVKF